MRSSTDLATSTSLIHNTVSARKLDQEHTSVSELVFQHWKSVRIRESIEMPFWDLIPRQLNHAIFRINSCCMRGRIPSWPLPCQSRSWEVQKICGFLSTSIARSASLPVFRDTGSLDADVILFECPKLLVVHLEQVGLQKRFLIYQTSSVHWPARRNRGWSIHEHSECSLANWERG